MAIVMSERDYKLVNLFLKVAGIFTFAGGTITIFDHGRVWLGVGLVLLGTLVTLAPVPMTVLKPRPVADAEEEEEMLSVDARL